MPDRPTKPTALGDLPELTEEEIADLEAANGLLQYDLMIRLMDQALENDALRLTPRIVEDLQRLAVVGLEPTAGQFRTRNVVIANTDHVPPHWQGVPDLVAELCDYVSTHWDTAGAIHLSAYVMWRLNWIHPFTNGNGRTSRAVSYLVLCAKLGMDLPGVRTIPERIDESKGAYYRALDDADAHFAHGELDVSVMEKIIQEALEAQLREALG